MPWYRHLLWPFAVLYGIVVWIRNRFFDLGIFCSKQFDVPVICVGNLETGGTGKSPLVNYIV
ncbi:MAG: tetraacyldisaccharide 4'-kinase, partial [Flavobacteriales bacterium]|nr:tetraacyldisaccharide 4'-kinase [Flavobacteriales bacterium]